MSGVAPRSVLDNDVLSAVRSMSPGPAGIPGVIVSSRASGTFRKERPLADSGAGHVTTLLHASQAGDAEALAQVFALLYKELHRHAHARMRSESPGHVLQTTGLVHETFLRLMDAKVDWQDRKHFLAVAARAMRRVLVDLARAGAYQKRGGGAVHVPLEDDLAHTDARSVDIVALDRALEGLAALDPRKAQVVELRFFGGLTVEEAADVLGVSADTIHRDWRLARTWLLKELSTGGAT